MILKELSEDELQRYVEDNLSEEEYDAYDSRREVRKMFDVMDKHIAALKVSTESLKQMMFEQTPNSYFVNEELKNVNVLLRRLVKKSGEIGRYSGFTGKKEMNRIVGEDLEMSMDGQRLHIVFPTLLPKKIERLSNQAVYSNADIRAIYEPAFTRFFSRGKHIIYSKKAVIIYTHIFSSQKEFKDHDNFETKIITDLITANLLLDDSPKHCAIFMDYRMGEHSHTEVDVIPFDELKDYLM